MDGGLTTIDNALTGFVEEIERHFDERRITSVALRDTYERAKAAGYVPAFLRQMAKERAMAEDDRAAKYRIEQDYRTKLGMLDGTPLGEAAMSAMSATETSCAAMPTPFAEQPVHRSRGRPRKPMLFDQEHPQGTA